MGHPVLDEILRARLPIRPDVLDRWQRVIRHEVIPALDAASQSQQLKKKADAKESSAA